MNELLQKFRQENPDYADWSDADLMYGLHEKFYSDMPFDEFRAMVEEGGPVNTGPTEQPQFPTLPPMVGGALDMLVAFGTGSLRAAGLGTNALVPGATEGYMAEVRQRAPDVARYTEGAGAATLGATAGLAIGSRIASAQAANPYGFRIVQNTPSLARRAGGAVVDFAKKRALQGLATTGTGALGAYIYDRITRDR